MTASDHEANDAADSVSSFGRAREGIDRSVRFRRWREHRRSAFATTIASVSWSFSYGASALPMAVRSTVRIPSSVDCTSSAAPRRAFQPEIAPRSKA